MVFLKKKRVKNTTTRRKLGTGSGLFPPLCRGCGERGDYLCDCCKKYILEHVGRKDLMEEFRTMFPEVNEVFEKVEFLGFRDEILGELVEEYKYRCRKGMAGVLAEVVEAGYLDDDTLDSTLGSPLILVPYPTSRKHMRERGFGHMEKLVRRIGRDYRGAVEVRGMLIRAKDVTQVGASEEVRRRQAKEAIKIAPRYLDEEGKLKEEYRGQTIVVVDDVWTTGASIFEAGRMLKRAGAEKLLALEITKNRAGRSPVIRRGKFN